MYVFVFVNILIMYYDIINYDYFIDTLFSC